MTLLTKQAKKGICIRIQLSTVSPTAFQQNIGYSLQIDKIITLPGIQNHSDSQIK